MNQQLLDWAKQALEMLNDNHHLVADNEKHRYVMMHLDVIKRGKALLEQPVQGEVVVKSNGHVSPLLTHMMNNRTKAATQPEPVQQKPLFADIIAKHPGLAEELKAMDAAPVQSAERGEPVAWADAEAISNLHAVDEAIRALLDNQTADNATAVVQAVLAATPPIAATPLAQPADWVGLTDRERKEIERQSVYVEGAIHMTEAKLREKNGGAA